MTWVHDQVFAAGGTHLPAHWASFAEQTQITAVLHLSAHSPQTFQGPCPASFLWLAIDHEDQASWDCRWLAGRFLQDELQRGGRALIHCSEGRHRTRWAFVSYLLLDGRSVRRALGLATEAPWLSPYRTDEANWNGFARWLREGRRGAEVV